LHVYFPVLLCLSVSVKWLAVKTASEMTYTVSGGALNSAQPQPPQKNSHWGNFGVGVFLPPPVARIRIKYYRQSPTRAADYVFGSVSVCLSVCVCSHILWTKYLQKYVLFSLQTRTRSLVVDDLKMIILEMMQFNMAALKKYNTFA